MIGISLSALPIGFRHFLKDQIMKKHILTQAVLASTLFLSAQAFATTMPPGTTVGTVETSAFGDHFIFVPGPGSAVSAQITDGNEVAATAGPAVEMDFNNSVLTLEAHNAKYYTGSINGDTIDASVAHGNATGNGEGVLITSDFAIVNVNEGTGITTINRAIIVDVVADDVNITIHGTVTTDSTSGNNTIEVSGKSANIIVGKMGRILSPGVTGANDGHAIQVFPTGDDFVLENAGIIESSGERSALRVGSTFSSITNKAGGFIRNVGAGNASAIHLLDGGGLFSNAGSISSTKGNALEIDGAITKTVENTGTISAPLGIAVSLDAGGTLNDEFQNSGNLTGLVKAIDMSNGVGTYRQLAGTVIGDVYLSEQGLTKGVANDNVFFMEGGDIQGSVFATTPDGTQNILTLSGGTIQDNVNLFDSSGGDIANLSGTDIMGKLYGGTSADTFNVSGGSFGSLDGQAGADILNVIDTFTANGTIANVPNINVQNSGTVFTQNQAITDLDTLLQIDKGTTMIVSNDITGDGSVNIDGSLKVLNGNIPTIDLSGGAGGVTNTGNTVFVEATGKLIIIGSTGTPAYTNQKGSVYQTGFTGTSAGVLQTTNDAADTIFEINSFIRPVISGFIPNGTKHLIAEETVENIIDDSTLQQPSSTLTFVRTYDDPTETNITKIYLTANRNAFSTLPGGSGPTGGVAGALDDLVANGPGPFTDLIVALDNLSNPTDVKNALTSLVPPFNYGLVKASQVAQDSAFEGVITRIEDLQSYKNGGVNFGDQLEGTVAVWGKVLGAHLHQRERDGFEGYKVKAAGGEIGIDYGFNQCARFGLAASYVHSTLDDEAINPKDASVKSYQGTAYGWIEFAHHVYMDAMIAYAHNDYHLNRIINVGPTLSTAAQADFNGDQFGAQADLGMAFSWDTAYLVPFARLKYSHLELDDYSEFGAGVLSLDVQNDEINTLMGGAGLKLGAKFGNSKGIYYVPEISAMVGYDMVQDGEGTVATFAGAAGVPGPTFATDGIKPARTLFNLGLGLNTHVCDRGIFTVKYNLEIRDEFVGNAGFVQWTYLWS